MPARVAIFDLDGTLIDSLADIANAMNRVLARFGLPEHPRAAYKRMVGAGMPMLVDRAMGAAAADRDLAGSLLAAMRQEYSRHQLDSTRPYPGIDDALTRLAELGCRLAVLSNKPHASAVAVTESLFGAQRFSVIRGVNPGEAPKPDPRGALAVLDTLGATPAEATFLGDSDIDMQTARAAGMRSIGCLWGFRDAEELIASGATIVVATPAEIPAWFAPPA